ncbi:CDC16 protein [Coemansia thaxteri]|nr:CDC16 protein [Coemansia thaxteri]
MHGARQEKAGARRGMTPRMVELSRRLSDIDIEFRESEGEGEEEADAKAEALRRGSALRLRDRLRVAASERARLDGLELVEPAKVDTQYREDSGTSAYLQRRGDQREEQRDDQRADQLRHRLVALTRRIHSDWAEVSASMRELRGVIAAGGGLPVAHGDGDRRLRATVWLAMLEVRGVGVGAYRRALARCPSASADKINNDAFRTLAGDAEFRARVPTAAIVRVLNAVESAPDRSPSDPPRYVQGMNALAAPFLFVMGEGAGFHAFRQFLRRECPLYARPSLPGVHACVQLVDEALAAADARLFSHLRRHGAVARIYAFPAAMTLSASVGPVRQVVRLWDFLLAYGAHLNVVCIVAQLLAMRELLLTTRAPMALLREWPPLRADSVIRRARSIYDALPDALRRRIKMHAHDARLAEQLASAPPVRDPLDLDPLEEAVSLKRDLPLSPAAPGPDPRVLEPHALEPHAPRGRARTFSGMEAKRMRTADESEGVPARAAPSYGALGLGLGPVDCRQNQNQNQNQQQQQRPRGLRVAARGLASGAGEALRLLGCALPPELANQQKQQLQQHRRR